MRFLAILFLTLPLAASEHRGVVKFGGLPVPGATITASQGERKLSTISDPDGAYSFADLTDGAWSIEVRMQLFSPERREVQVSAETPVMQWELKVLPLDQIGNLTVASAAPPPPPVAAVKPVAGAKPAPTNTATPFQRTDLAASREAPAAAPPRETVSAQDTAELSQRAADGFLINGSVNNGAVSPFAQLPAFGNNRRGARSLYNGNLGLIVDNSALDARSFSLTGQDTPKPAYSRIQGLASFGGPLKIPGLIKRNGPNVTVNYQWTRNSNATVQTGLMPTLDQRNGILGGSVVPQSRISPEALALLKLYPLPNFTGSTRYNYQIPLVGGLHQDDLQTRATKLIGRKNQVSGNFALQHIRTDSTNLFGFLDTGRTLGIDTSANWRHSFSPRLFLTLGAQYNRLNARTTPFFANRRNVSGDAGINGNNQDAANWGPPALVFASGITQLSDVQSSLTRNQTSAATADMFWSRGRHNVTAGSVLRKQQFNVLSQQDPRGTFTFTGAAAGSDFAGFLIGVPDTSSIAYGNADKYLRGHIVESYANDDWRMNPGFTLNFGIRWEYWSPVTEKYGRLVNLDIAPGYTAVTPHVGAALHPDRNNLAPRLGFSWRPLAASSMVVRGGYGIYYDTAIYQPIAMQMAQQAPLSTSLRVDNSAANPLTLANGFRGSSAITATTFAVDPDLRVGYSQSWQISVQRDLPQGMQMTATYNGAKGTHAQQQFLPNTFPGFSVNPAGFTFLSSNGNSTRNAGQIQLRRRLRSGFTAQLQYTWSKSIDNAALGGRGQGATLIAQNWLDLRAERGLSNFDQRHQVTATVQYTPGMGLHGGALANGWKAALAKEWTIGTQITAGSGLPLTPVYLVPVRGTGVTGSLRPDYTGASLYDAPAGLSLNPAAFTAPAPGHWGNAGRNSITGPSQFVMNASLSRTFRSAERLSMDLRIDAANAINHVTFPSWNTIVGNSQFGLPMTANAMRSVQTALRLRF